MMTIGPDGWCLLVDKNLYLNYKLDSKDLLGFFQYQIFVQDFKKMVTLFKQLKIIRILFIILEEVQKLIQNILQKAQLIFQNYL